MMEDSDRYMDSDCVNDISKATDSPQKKKWRLPEQHFLPAYTAEWPAVVRSKLEKFHAYANVTFRFDMGMGAASIFSGILKQPSTYRTRSELNPRSSLVNS